MEDYSVTFFDIVDNFVENWNKGRKFSCLVLAVENQDLYVEIRSQSVDAELCARQFVSYFLKHFSEMSYALHACGYFEGNNYVMRFNLGGPNWYLPINTLFKVSESTWKFYE